MIKTYAGILAGKLLEVLQEKVSYLYFQLEFKYFVLENCN